MTGFNEQLSDVIRIMEGTPKIDFPANLVREIEGPFARSYQEHAGVVWVNNPAAPLYKKYLSGFSDWDDFASEVSPGYLAIGVTSLLGEFSEYVVHSNSSDVMLFMKFSSLSTAEIGPTVHINEYLDDLSKFVRNIRYLDLKVEVVEQPGFGRYRLFDKQGRGIEKDMKLINSESRNRELNRLLAEVSLLNVRLDSSIEQFLAHQDKFQMWQHKHPRGSVLVLTPDLMPSRPFVHSAGCPTMIEEQLPENKVICAADMRDLLKWANENDLAVPGLCSRCFFL